MSGAPQPAELPPSTYEQIMGDAEARELFLTTTQAILHADPACAVTARIVAALHDASIAYLSVGRVDLPSPQLLTRDIICVGEEEIMWRIGDLADSALTGASAARSADPPGLDV